MKEGSPNVGRKDKDIAEEAMTDHFGYQVKAFCKDLLVLGKQDLEHLLEYWRMHMGKSLSSSPQKDSPTASYAEDEIEGDAELISERQAKDKSIRMQKDALEDGYADDELSSLSSIKDQADLMRIYIEPG
ncbi:hypothetical protein C5167_042479 [Papaver somniferum]|uniref:DUF3381 domain-containing protein n=1 Tax=Papaver somniferum TaxID=3469 RepID=A0A4Y7L2X9_PAPSO|nr:hypothetical protein C5167_042479 [Papaver somniferum]